jgi:hypothetical protein
VLSVRTPNSRAALDATGAAVSLGVDAVVHSLLPAGGVVGEDVVAAVVVEEGRLRLPRWLRERAALMLPS